MIICYKEKRITVQNTYRRLDYKSGKEIDSIISRFRINVSQEEG